VAVIPLARLPEVLAAYRAAGKRIVCTNGCFDVLHRGHVEHLRQARELGDVLVVGVNDDAAVRRLKGPHRPINPAVDRAVVLAALACVEHVTIFPGDDAVGLVELVRPDVYVKGGDYRRRPLPEAAAVAQQGGRVVLLGYFDGRSTSAIVERIRAV
jgi:D-beta-D-heptose 7-phosphate kinase / D-beta-D-heptose 1-phosphate adenosyltransferase